MRRTRRKSRQLYGRWRTAQPPAPVVVRQAQPEDLKRGTRTRPTALRSRTT